MNIALDIDGTITQAPEFFCSLSRSVRKDGGKILIITSRANDPLVAEKTREELQLYGVDYDELFIIPDKREYMIPCPHDHIDWYRKYLWQKVRLCLDHNVTVVFEDDSKVIALFGEFAPDIQVFQVQ